RPKLDDRASPKRPVRKIISYERADCKAVFGDLNQAAICDIHKFLRIAAVNPKLTIVSPKSAQQE
ncbi:hypothetical protein, partial [Methylomonas koyamae]|uniref:hypothetical protein n=1 Tax=Methylomonas koyamae TaxID=702114 RepID=UPI001E58E8B6